MCVSVRVTRVRTTYVVDFDPNYWLCLRPSKWTVETGRVLSQDLHGASGPATKFGRMPLTPRHGDCIVILL